MNTNPVGRWFYLGFLLISVGACKKDESVQAVVDAGVVVTGPNASPLQPGLGLMGQLQQEAGTRPIDTPHCEVLMGEMEKAGLTFGTYQQSLARTHNARYCINLRNADLYVFMCEFGAQSDVVTGYPISQKVFESAPNHTFHFVKNTMVMIQRLTPAGEEQAKKAIAALEAVK